VEPHPAEKIPVLKLSLNTTCPDSERPKAVSVAQSPHTTSVGFTEPVTSHCANSWLENRMVNAAANRKILHFMLRKFGLQSLYESLLGG